MFRLAMAALAALSVAACATPTRFEWGNYENSLYGYYKKPDSRETYRKSLIDAIERGEKSQRLAPGLHAELGFLSLEDGKNAEAIAQFEKEMAAFPESRSFLSSIVARVSGAPSAAATQVTSAPGATALPVSAQAAQ